MANLTITKVTDGYFDFNDDANNTYGGNNISYWYDATNIYFKVDERVYTYTYAEVSYDDGSEIIGFASTIEVITALKTAGFTGNFNSGGSSSLPTDVEDALLGANSPSASNVFATINDVENASSTIKMLPADVTTTLATAQTITALTQALDINSTYIIRGNLRNGCSGTGGVKFAVSYPTGTIAVLQALGQLASINSASWNIHGNAISGVLQNAVTTFASNSGTYNLQGTIKTGGTAGNLTFSFASTTAGQTSTIFTDSSYIEIIKVV